WRDFPPSGSPWRQTGGPWRAAPPPCGGLRRKVPRARIRRRSPRRGGGLSSLCRTPSSAHALSQFQKASAKPSSHRVQRHAVDIGEFLIAQTLYIGTPHGRCPVGGQFFHTGV